MDNTTYRSFNITFTEYELKRYVGADTVQHLRAAGMFDDFICDLVDEVEQDMLDALVSGERGAWVVRKYEDALEDEEE